MEKSEDSMPIKEKLEAAGIKPVRNTFLFKLVEILEVIPVHLPKLTDFRLGKRFWRHHKLGPNGTDGCHQESKAACSKSANQVFR